MSISRFSSNDVWSGWRQIFSPNQSMVVTTAGTSFLSKFHRVLYLLEALSLASRGHEDHVDPRWCSLGDGSLMERRYTDAFGCLTEHCRSRAIIFGFIIICWGWLRVSSLVNWRVLFYFERSIALSLPPNTLYNLQI